ncbi:hypothetical protein [uncultured Acinetobacter sp.]|uniref:hypothetical protein n=1 Tax=uncultured Acinetobacter sp. TaxID=165433 RepID=UPI0037484E7B
MDKCREAFEKTRTFKEFDARSPVVFSNFGGYVSAEDGRPQVYLNGALASYQEQQKRIDELQAKVEAVKQLIGEYKDPAITSDKSFQHGLLLVVDELEQALKGGEE